MFKVSGLNTKLHNSRFVEYKQDEYTFLNLYLEALGQANKCTGREKIEAYALSTKLRNVDEVEFEKAEVELLKKCVENMRTMMREELPGHIYAQLMSKLV